MGIFHQMGPFLEVLVVWGARVEVLAICGTSCKTDSNLKCNLKWD